MKDDEMTVDGAKNLMHKLYHHIHDDEVLCAKCQAQGYLAGWNSAIEKVIAVYKHEGGSALVQKFISLTVEVPK